MLLINIWLEILTFSGSSSYPKQTFGTAAAGGGAAGAAGSMSSGSYPKQTWGSSPGSVGTGSYPKQTWGSSANTPGNAGRGTYPGASAPPGKINFVKSILANLQELRSSVSSCVTMSVCMHVMSFTKLGYFSK